MVFRAGGSESVGNCPIPSLAINHSPRIGEGGVGRRGPWGPSGNHGAPAHPTVVSTGPYLRVCGRPHTVRACTPTDRPLYAGESLTHTLANPTPVAAHMHTHTHTQSQPPAPQPEAACQPLSDRLPALSALSLGGRFLLQKGLQPHASCPFLRPLPWGEKGDGLAV